MSMADPSPSQPLGTFWKAVNWRNGVTMSRSSALPMAASSATPAASVSSMTLRRAFASVNWTNRAGDGASQSSEPYSFAIENVLAQFVWE